jgi:hypothetical protein
MNDFNTLPTRILDNGFIHIEALAHAGPRIMRLSAFGSPNLLAVLTPKENRITAYGEYHFMGGHRLWHAPEALPRSYIPDDDGLTTEDLPPSTSSGQAGIRLLRPAEAGSGIAKTIDIHLAPGRAAATLVHTLRNDGLWEVVLAPWTLTMFRINGTAILPQPIGDPKGLLHNRILAIWPYTRLNDPRLILRDDFILIRPNAEDVSPLKIGYYNPHGWMAYWLDGILFRKTFNLHQPNLTYPDGGCNTASYCSDSIELEALGPLEKLAPGASVTLTETWELFPSIDQPFIPAEIRALLTD